MTDLWQAEARPRRCARWIRRRVLARRPEQRSAAAAKNPQEESPRRRRNNVPIAGLRRAVLTTMLTRLLPLLTAVDRLIVTADRHRDGVRCVAQLARLGCAGLGLVVLLAALELRWSALALVGG
ncbi:hypothetical protein [Burkholderia glumae]|nr:hypothetical protein [Burkholderia glumae]MCQ0031518.1 hypothetical protein [Burkholderia glumae]MCQ0035170.1 hypothetical protein [Burkholderia glumae]